MADTAYVLLAEFVLPEGAAPSVAKLEIWKSGHDRWWSSAHRGGIPSVVQPGGASIDPRRAEYWHGQPRGGGSQLIALIHAAMR
jgi:hypothetical protein